MRKFAIFLKLSWQNTLAYREESVVWFILEAVPLTYMISFWINSRTRGNISESQASSLIFYQITSLFVSRFTATHYEEWVIDEIKDGNISNALIKPIPYRIYLLASEVAWKLFGLVYLLPIFICLLPFLSQLKGLNLIIGQIPFVVVIFSLAFAQRFLVSWLIAISAFWFEQAQSLVHLKWMLEGILGGSWLPIYFYPHWFQTIARITPFYYWYYLPINSLTHSLNSFEKIVNIAFPISWIIALFFLGNWLWHKAIRKFTAVGR